MIDKEAVEREYRLSLNLNEALRDEVVFEISKALEQTDIKYHSVTARVKKLESLLVKAENKQVIDVFAEINDVVGARIVALFLSDLQRILKMLNESFDVVFTDNKIDDTDPRLFGYFSIHVNCRLKNTHSGTRYDRIKHKIFEIQVRTIAMDAWAAASHYLDYKSEADVPADLRRDFNALSGLFYVADKHFETFFRARTAKIRRIDRAFQTDNPPLNDALDLDTLVAYLRDRYPQRPRSDSSTVSELLSELREAGYSTLAQVDSALNAKGSWFKSYESNDPIIDHQTKQPIPYADVGIVRISLNDGPYTVNFERMKPRSPAS